LSYSAEPVASQYALPAYNRTVGYVQTLINTYNTLVNSTLVKRSDFSSISASLSLYHEVGHSFHVVVLQSVPDNSDYVALMFFPIQATQPNVTMDYKDTFASLFQNAFYIASEYGLLENNKIVYGNQVILLPLVWVILSSDISGDYLTNAKNAAQYIFQQDTKTIPPPPPPAHTTYSVTISPTATVSPQVSVTMQSSSTEQLSTQPQPPPQKTLTVATTKTNFVPEYIGTTTVTSNLSLLISDLNEIAVNAIAIILAAVVLAVGAILGYQFVKKASQSGKETWLSKLARELLRDKAVKEEDQSNANVEKNRAKRKKSKK